MLFDQVDEYAQVGQDDDEDDPIVLAPVRMSSRRKMSVKTVIRIQIQITNVKKMSIVQNTSRNGYAVAIKA